MDPIISTASGAVLLNRIAAARLMQALPDGGALDALLIYVFTVCCDLLMVDPPLRKAKHHPRPRNVIPNLGHGDIVTPIPRNGGEAA
jgi:hypothetical protein